MGKKSKRNRCFLVETGVEGTTTFRGGTLNFYGASAVNKKRVSAIRGGLEKDSWDAQGGVGTGQADHPLRNPPPPPHQFNEQGGGDHSAVGEHLRRWRRKMRGGNSHKGVQVVSTSPQKKSGDCMFAWVCMGGGVHFPHIEFSHTAPPLPACFFLSAPVKGDVDF